MVRTECDDSAFQLHFYGKLSKHINYTLGYFYEQIHIDLSLYNKKHKHELY